jgi:hypothetical protein
MRVVPQASVTARPTTHPGTLVAHVRASAKVEVRLVGTKSGPGSGVLGASGAPETSPSNPFDQRPSGRSAAS